MDEQEYTDLIRGHLLTDEPMVRDNPILFCMIGFAGEAGETANIAKKLMRGDFKPSDLQNPGILRVHRPRHNALVLELGDAMWYLYNLMDQIGVDPAEVRRRNAVKIIDRHKRGVVRGDGDNR